MIHLEYVDRARSTQTTPVVCMHCDQPMAHSLSALPSSVPFRR
jgi:hypothetical protein